jgi:alkylhydroperoxidase family enzyme
MPPLLPPLPLDTLPSRLQASIERGKATRMLGSTLPVQVWAHRPDAAFHWLATLEQFHLYGLLDERLRELVRLRIAAITNCQACQISRKSDTVSEEDVSCLASDNARFTPAERVALRFAELFAGDYQGIGDALFDQLKRFFTTEQIVELNMFCALMLAGGRMTYVQRAY